MTAIKKTLFFVLKAVGMVVGAIIGAIIGFLFAIFSFV